MYWFSFVPLVRLYGIDPSFPLFPVNSFAGPSFNLLIGLGCGLLTQKESLLSSNGLPIFLGTSVYTGFAFLICNCVITVFCGILNKGLIPKM